MTEAQRIYSEQFKRRTPGKKRTYESTPPHMSTSHRVSNGGREKPYTAGRNVAQHEPKHIQ